MTVLEIALMATPIAVFAFVMGLWLERAMWAAVVPRQGPILRRFEHDEVSRLVERVEEAPRQTDRYVALARFLVIVLDNRRMLDTELLPRLKRTLIASGASNTQSEFSSRKIS